MLTTKSQKEESNCTVNAMVTTTVHFNENYLCVEQNYDILTQVLKQVLMLKEEDEINNIVYLWKEIALNIIVK